MYDLKTPDIILVTTVFLIFPCRWRIFRRPIIALPENVILIAKAAICLHNFLRTTESTIYCPPGFIDGEDGAGNIVLGHWRNDDQSSSMCPISRNSSNR